MDSVISAPGGGRYTAEHFEERTRNRGREFTRRLGNIYTNAGLDPLKMSEQENQMLRHVLTEGNANFPPDPRHPNATIPIPDHILAAGGNLRDLLNEAWSLAHRSGLDIGYAKSGYFPRMYDLAKILTDGTGFTEAAKQVHKIMFDNDVGRPGANPEALFEKWNSKMSPEDKRNAPGSLRADMLGLGKNLARQRAIEAELANPIAAEPGKPGTDPIALRAELDQLRRLATANAERIHPVLSDHLAGLDADDWRLRMTTGAPTEFDGQGPSGRFLNARTLPPEADRLLRDYMFTDPAVALPHYFDAVSRRVAQAELFGADGKLLEQKLKQAEVAGAFGGDVQLFREMINNVTGRNQNRGQRQLQNIHQMLHAFTSAVLMSRAVWSSFAEPMNAALATGDMRVGFKAFANQFGALIRTASSRERTELAQFLNVVTTPMHDAVMMSRMGADYSTSPNIQRALCPSIIASPA